MRLIPLLALALFAASVFVSASLTPAAAQCHTTDKPINKRIRFSPGRTTTVIKDTVRLCTSHEYRLRARARQTMSIHLVTGNRTSFSLYSPNEPVSEGVRDWTGELPESGEYLISIGTDTTARYTLEVTIR
jgi:hypothetical protein